MSAFRTMKKAGPLRNGAERGKGTILHSAAIQADGRAALCGQQPAIMWSDCEGREVSFPRCLKKLEKLAKGTAA
jgi:hypothetical protein